LLIAVFLAPTLTNLGQVFQFIQEYTGFLTPGVMAIFLFALAWKRTTSTAALSAVILTIPVSAILKYALPDIGFLNRMGIAFVILCAVITIITLRSEPNQRQSRYQPVERASFKTPQLFNVLALAMLGTVAALYLYFW